MLLTRLTAHKTQTCQIQDFSPNIAAHSSNSQKEKKDSSALRGLVCELSLKKQTWAVYLS